MAIQYNNTAVTATTASGTLVPAREKRQYLALTNNGAVAVNFAINGTAVAGQGGQIAANGGQFIIEEKDHINEAITVITGSSTASVSVAERYLDAV